MTWRRISLQESNLLRLAEQQARREEELNVACQRAAALEAEVSDLVREVELRQEQEAALKEARFSIHFLQRRVVLQ